MRIQVSILRWLSILNEFPLPVCILDNLGVPIKPLLPIHSSPPLISCGDPITKYMWGVTRLPHRTFSTIVLKPGLMTTRIMKVGCDVNGYAKYVFGFFWGGKGLRSRWYEAVSLRRYSAPGTIPIVVAELMGSRSTPL